MAPTLHAPAQTLTYEEYMAEPQVEGRYDIIEGVRILRPGASWDHQTVSGNLYDLLRNYGRDSGIGKALYSPFDVLIRHVPRLQTRQPDILLISHTRLTQAGGRPRVGPLEAAPELVVEIISDSETQHILNDKLTDYISIGVDECWVVRPESRTIEILRLTPNGPQTVAIYDDTQTVTSVILPTLTVPVADVFAP